MTTRDNVYKSKRVILSISSARGNQGIFKTRNPSTGFKGQIRYTATIPTIPPPQNMFRAFGNLNNFYSSTHYNSATSDQSPITLDAPPPRNTDNTYIQSRNYEQFIKSTPQFKL